MAEGDDYTKDEDLMREIDDAKGPAKRVIGDLANKNANDLHILVAGQADPRPISLGLEYPNFAALKNDQDGNGMTPLMYAADQLKGDIILLLAGTQTGLKNNEGHTALEIFEQARNADPEGFPDDPDYLTRVRRALGAAEGGRRKKKTRARKTKHRQTRRRR